METHFTAYVALGANLPWRGQTPGQTLRSALLSLGEMGCLLRASSLWTTRAEGPVRDQPDFVNAAAIVQTTLDPEQCLAQLLALEHRFGRTRTGLEKGPRTLDLDLLLMEDAAGRPLLRETPGLTLPHPEMHRRVFVLGPLAEIAPELCHPVTGRTVQQMHREWTSKAGRAE